MTSQLGNVTSSNATLVLTAETVFPAGITLEQFSTEDIFSMDELTVMETRMGIDGKLMASYVPSVQTVTIKLEPASPSHLAMTTLYAAIKANQCPFECTLVATLPSIRQIYTWSGGTLKSGTPVPNAKKTLEATSWKFEFADLNITSY